MKDIFFELSEVGSLEIGQTHEDSVWDPEMEIGGIASAKTATEGNTTREDFNLIYVRRKCGKFLGTKGFKTRRGCGEKGVGGADNMPLNPLLVAMGHPTPS